MVQQISWICESSTFYESDTPSFILCLVGRGHSTGTTQKGVMNQDQIANVTGCFNRGFYLWLLQSIAALQQSSLYSFLDVTKERLQWSEIPFSPRGKTYEGRHHYHQLTSGDSVPRYIRATCSSVRDQKSCRRNERRILSPWWPLGTETVSRSVKGRRGKAARRLRLARMMHFAEWRSCQHRVMGTRQDMIHWSNWTIAQRQWRRLRLTCSCGSPPLGDFSGCISLLSGLVFQNYLLCPFLILY